MMKGFRKYILVGIMAFVLSCVFCTTDCYAVFENLTDTGVKIFGGMQKIIFASAGFGIIAVALGGLFGVLNWKWLAAIIIGIVVVAGTAGILSYMTAGTGADTSVKGITYTLVNAMED